MKTIGLIAGMSWQSSLEYYRLINEMVNEKLGGFHSAKILMSSIDFAEIEDCQRTGDWDGASYILAQAGQDLQCCGAEIILLCTNTMHKVVPNINKIASMPLLHIADATANKVIANQFSKVGLLGTKFTMEEDFYKDRLRLRGLEVIIPQASDRYFINKVIFEELCCGIISSSSRLKFVSVINSLAEQGAECVILGCTEIPLLVKQAVVPIPLFDTMLIHVEAAVELALLK
jgi:aspartate racemase